MKIQIVLVEELYLNVGKLHWINILSNLYIWQPAAQSAYPKKHCMAEIKPGECPTPAGELFTPVTLRKNRRKINGFPECGRNNTCF
jgi:hypothetical protein